MLVVMIKLKSGKMSVLDTSLVCVCRGGLGVGGGWTPLPTSVNCSVKSVWVWGRVVHPCPVGSAHPSATVW